MRTLTHDAFARASVVRAVVHAAGRSCAWCGAVKQSPSGKRTLYQYGQQSDGYGARVAMEREVFCGKSCHDSYHS